MTTLRHSGVYTENIDAMIDFYIEVFDMRIASRAIEKGDYIDNVLGTGPHTELDVCKMTFHGGGMIELIGANVGNENKCREHDLYDKGMHHIAITVDSAEETYDKISDRGCECISAPTVNADSTAKVFFARDPEGNYLELVEMI